jgi:hypothetical protein
VVRLLRSVDPSVTEYIVKNRDVTDDFPYILSLAQGSIIDPTKMN